MKRKEELLWITLIAGMAGQIIDAEIKAQPGSNVMLLNNGQITPMTNKNFLLIQGAKMRLGYGEIK